MQTYKYDTHVHTDETSSCARIKGSQLVNLYKNSGYQGVVITDHYCPELFESMHNITWNEKIEKFLEGYRNAYDESRKVGFDVILGIELRIDRKFKNVQECL